MLGITVIGIQYDAWITLFVGLAVTVVPGGDRAQLVHVPGWHPFRELCASNQERKDIGVTREPPAAQGGDPGLMSVKGWESRPRLQR